MSEQIKLELGGSIQNLDIEEDLPAASAASVAAAAAQSVQEISGMSKEAPQAPSSKYLEDVSLTEEEQKMVDDFSE